ncbi:hypothetical protein QVD17_39301 [Tagetes erecta]|uniref:Uncharacterized protein n=1 Tax=Tagetes erecta TaxID=13708 RepID=A0AAD8JNA8_TARER|nr:hypothetical protein QVD17_39301 [Tagetes erecta]
MKQSSLHSGSILKYVNSSQSKIVDVLQSTQTNPSKQEPKFLGSYTFLLNFPKTKTKTKTKTKPNQNVFSLRRQPPFLSLSLSKTITISSSLIHSSSEK